MIIKRGEGQITEILDDENNEFIDPTKTGEALEKVKKEAEEKVIKAPKKPATN